MVYYIAGYGLKIFLSIFGFLKVKHKEKLPENEGFVIACTHTGWVDILWLGISILPLKIHYMAKKELFESGFLNWLMNALNAFPVDRENPGPSSIKTPVRSEEHTSELQSRGHLVCRLLLEKKKKKKRNKQNATAEVI